MIRTLILADTKPARNLYKDMLLGNKYIDLVKIIEKENQLLEEIKKNKIELIIINIEVEFSINIQKIKKDAKLNNIPLFILSNIHQGVFTRMNEKKDRDIIEEKINLIEAYAKSLNASIGNNLIMIGSSTGGPKALQKIIPRLPSNLNATILIVQHMPQNFTKPFAERLNSCSALEVREAIHGEGLKKGTVYIAPGDYHMLLSGNSIKTKILLDKGEKHKGLRPAADLLMESSSKITGYRKMGIILTGMGTDGSIGVETIKKSGGHTIVQDKETSTIFGMPKAAYETGFIDEVINLNDMAERIILKVGCSDGFRY